MISQRKDVGIEINLEEEEKLEHKRSDQKVQKDENILGQWINSEPSQYLHKRIVFTLINKYSCAEKRMTY